MCACHTQDLRARCRTTSSVRRNLGRANAQSARGFETASASPVVGKPCPSGTRRLQAKVSARDKLKSQSLSVSKHIGRDFSPMRVVPAGTNVRQSIRCLVSVHVGRVGRTLSAHRPLTQSAAALQHLSDDIDGVSISCVMYPSRSAQRITRNATERICPIFIS